jgi:exopolyphosphatase/pppGpp-phosphohydrolase
MTDTLTLSASLSLQIGQIKKSQKPQIASPVTKNFERMVQDGNFNRHYLPPETKISLGHAAERASHFLHVYETNGTHEKKQLISALECRYQEDLFKLQNSLS